MPIDAHTFGCYFAIMKILHYYAIAAAPDRAALEFAVRAALAAQNIELWTYLELCPPECVEDSYWISSFPEEWIELYQRRRYCRVDPSLTVAPKTMEAMLWPTANQDPDILAFYDHAGEYGVKHGVTIPVHGPGAMVGLLTLCCPDARRNTAAWYEGGAEAWQILANAVFRRSMALGRKIPSAIKLSPRQAEVLEWTALGKTAKEIGAILGIAERTAEHHLSAAMAKLNTYPKSRAAAVAESLELIDPGRHRTVADAAPGDHHGQAQNLLQFPQGSRCREPEAD